MPFQKRYEDIFKCSPVGIVLYDSTYRMIEVNPYFVALTGYSEEELLHLTFLDITHPDDVPNNRNLAMKHFQGDISGYKLEKRYVCKNGEIIWVAVTTAKFPTKEDLGIAIVENINSRITMDAALTQQTKKLIEVLNDSRSELETFRQGEKRKRILLADDDGIQRMIARKYLRNENFEIIEAEDGRQTNELLQKENFDLVILDLNMPFKNGYEILELIPNEERPLVLVCSAAKGKTHHLTKTFQFGADDYLEKPYDADEFRLRIKSLLRHQTKISEAQKISETDELTGLSNLRSLNLRFPQILEISRKNNLQFGLVNLDINKLKFINDKFGHSAGSLLIQKAAYAIIYSAGEKAICVRIGGDEFVVILLNSSKEIVEAFIQRLKSQLLGQKFYLEGEEIIPSLAIGYAIFPENGNSREDLMHHADIEMYKNKALIKAQESFQ